MRIRHIAAAFVATLTIGVGMIGVSPASAVHFTGATTSKVCATSGNSLTFECVLTLQLSANRSLATGQAVNVALVGNAAYSSIVVTGTCSATGVITTPTSLTITPTAPCAAGSTIIVTETLTATGTGGGTLCQSPSTAGHTPIVTLCAPNFTVPLVVGPPTSADECKKDGWMAFNNPAFKNQGDCVSFVVTGGRNPANG